MRHALLFLAHPQKFAQQSEHNMGAINVTRAGGSDVIVTTWASRPAISSLVPFTDKVIFTDIGMGGSEWYSDGVRYRAVGGSVVLDALRTTDTIPTASWSASTGIQDIALPYSVPAGILQAGDIIELEGLANCSAGTSLNSMFMNWRVGGKNVSQLNAVTLTYQANVNGVNSSSRASFLGAARLDSNTQISSIRPASPSGYGTQSGTQVARQDTVVNVSTTALPIDIRATCATASTGTLAIESFTVTLRTCG
jgi:hypothetical protein